MGYPFGKNGDNFVWDDIGGGGAPFDFNSELSVMTFEARAIPKGGSGGGLSATTESVTHSGNSFTLTETQMTNYASGWVAFRQAPATGDDNNQEV